MFHKVKSVDALPEYKLSVQFAEGVTKIYNVSQLFDKHKMLLPLKEKSALFEDVIVDRGGADFYEMSHIRSRTKRPECTCFFEYQHG